MSSATASGTLCYTVVAATLTSVFVCKEKKDAISSQKTQFNPGDMTKQTGLGNATQKHKT